MATGFHSVVIDVADLEVGVRDFARLLGFAPVPASDPPETAARAIFMLSNMSLELRRVAGGQEGIARLRFDCGGLPGVRRAPGSIQSPTVPIELVAEEDAHAPVPVFPDGGVAAHVVGLDHVVVATGDPERARRFLGDDLGLRLALDRSFPERGLRLLFFRLGGVTIEVAASLAERSPSPGQDIFHGLAWRVLRIDAIHARLRDAGVALTEIRAGHKPGTRVCSLREPLHGVPTLLIEHLLREGW